MADEIEKLVRVFRPLRHGPYSIACVLGCGEKEAQLKMIVVAGGEQMHYAQQRSPLIKMTLFLTDR